MNKVEFHADSLETLRAEHPELTDAQRRTIADKIVAKEAADVLPLWDWTNAERRREQLGCIVYNMREAEPDLFTPPPSAEQIFNAKIAALEKQLGDDKGHPSHPTNPQVRRTLYRECQALTPDERSEAAKGLEIPKGQRAEIRHDPPAASKPTVQFSKMTPQELDAEASRRWGGDFSTWTARDRARYHDMLRKSDADNSAAKRIVDLASSKGGPSNLSPGERRTVFRAKLHLAATK